MMRFAPFQALACSKCCFIYSSIFTSSLCWICYFPFSSTRTPRTKWWRFIIASQSLPVILGQFIDCLHFIYFSFFFSGSRTSGAWWSSFFRSSRKWQRGCKLVYLKYFQYCWRQNKSNLTLKCNVFLQQDNSIFILFIIY